MAWQKDFETGALVRLAIDQNKAIGLFDNPVDRRQPEPSALADIFGGKKWIKDFGHNVFAHANALILDFEQNILASQHTVFAIFAGFALRDVFGANRQPATIGHGIACIDSQVNHHLIKLRLISLDHPQITLTVHLKLDPFAQ